MRDFIVHRNPPAPPGVLGSHAWSVLRAKCAQPQPAWQADEYRTNRAGF
jgi:hypothetical protein